MEVTRFLPLLGRLLIGLPFLMSGFGKLTTYAATTGYDQNQMIHFLKNIMIIGGLLQIAHFGAGRFSLDARNPNNVAGATT